MEYKVEVNIDPLALLIPPHIYATLRGPRPVEVSSVLKGLSKTERKETVERAKTLRAYADNFLEETSKVEAS